LIKETFEINWTIDICMSVYLTLNSNIKKYTNGYVGLIDYFKLYQYVNSMGKELK